MNNNPTRVSLAQRLGVFHGLFFLVMGGLMLLLTYGFSYQLVLAEENKTLRVLAQHYYDIYKLQGLDALNKSVRERDDLGEHSHLIVAILAPDQRVIAGNISQWPPDLAKRPGKVKFVSNLDDPHPFIAHGLVAEIRNDFMILVAKDSEELNQFQGYFVQAGFLLVMLATLSAVFAGYLAAKTFETRLTSLSDVAVKISDGQLSQRVDLAKVDRELAPFAAEFNRTIDDLTSLMADMQTVTDNVAHDMRLPLTRLRGQLERLLARDELAEEVQEAINELDEIIRLFNAILAIAAIDAQVIPTRGPKVDVKELVGDLIELYQPVIEDAGLQLHTRITNVVTIPGVKTWLFQALVNLLENAIKFTPRGGAIAVVLEQESLAVKLIIADSGPGIDQRDRERVLQRFVRLDQARSTKGFGLGLTFVASVVRRHKGTIELADNQPGLKVIVTLPMLP